MKKASSVRGLSQNRGVINSRFLVERGWGDSSDHLLEVVFLFHRVSSLAKWTVLPFGSERVARPPGFTIQEMVVPFLSLIKPVLFSPAMWL